VAPSPLKSPYLVGFSAEFAAGRPLSLLDLPGQGLSKRFPNSHHCGVRQRCSQEQSFTPSHILLLSDIGLRDIYLCVQVQKNPFLVAVTQDTTRPHKWQAGLIFHPRGTVERGGCAALDVWMLQTLLLSRIRIRINSQFFA
jgi:hypothetical protein